jgi:hypothetical protein
MESDVEVFHGTLFTGITLSHDQLDGSRLLREKVEIRVANMT